MCEDLSRAERDRTFTHRVSRRTLGEWALKLGVGTGAVTALGCAIADPAATAGSDDRTVTETRVQVPTPNGSCDALFVHPSSGQHPAVVLWPDILGLRPAYELMARRLAGDGYAVLAVNPYYRSQSAPVVQPGEGFRDEAVWARIRPLRQALSRTTTSVDAAAFIAYLDASSAVDSSRGAGVMGYCMSGPMAVWSAAAVPGRLKAIASFHGSRMAGDSDDSPHRVLETLDAEVLIAIADNDDQKQPEAKRLLQAALDDGAAVGTVEVYAGANHGWCPPDGPAYNEAQAERAWAALLTLFGSALA
ncbi:MAG: dienelactone hydrolase family protein [Pseudomonadota bacterium]